MGRRHIRSIESLPRKILSHLLLAVAMPDSPAARHWLNEVAAFQPGLCNIATRSLLSRVDLERAWHLAVRDVWKKSRDMNGIDDPAAVIARLTYDDAPCPLTLDELCAVEFDAREAAQRFLLGWN
jgi:hypothetical protein